MSQQKKKKKERWLLLHVPHLKYIIPLNTNIKKSHHYKIGTTPKPSAGSHLEDDAARKLII